MSSVRMVVISSVKVNFDFDRRSDIIDRLI